MNAMTLDEARAHAESIPLEQIDLSDAELFRSDTVWPYFARLRRDDPVHWRQDGVHGSFWSVTKFNDIMAVDTNHEVFSSDSARGGIAIFDAPVQMRRPMFISMDPPKHDEQRKAVSPIVAPGNLATLEPLIRSRVRKILDDLPVGEVFDWVPRVSIELTTQMLATLFDFPFEDRRLLTYWSDVATNIPPPGQPDGWERRDAELRKCLEYFTRLWNERVNQPPRNDLVSMLAHAPATRNMGPMEFLGNLVLLIVGGNDTTRNSISGGLLFMNQNPGEYAKLRANRKLIPSAVSEIIRYQTPLAHMRRTAVRDFELGGKQIREGDKVVMWYISGNRDETAIENPDAFLIDRARPRQHLSFGFGIHRCVGNRLAELQLNILWEELLERHPVVEVVGEPVRVPSCFVHGYASLPVRIPAH
ncbi:MAG: cytochrome P450 [Burkholderiaceae bacterium]